MLNHRRFCNWTDRSAEVLSVQLVRDVYRAAVAVERLGVSWARTWWRNPKQNVGPAINLTGRI